MATVVAWVNTGTSGRRQLSGRSEISLSSSSAGKWERSLRATLQFPGPNVTTCVAVASLLDSERQSFHLRMASYTLHRVVEMQRNHTLYRVFGKSEEPQMITTAPLIGTVPTGQYYHSGASLELPNSLVRGGKAVTTNPRRLGQSLLTGKWS